MLIRRLRSCAWPAVARVAEAADGERRRIGGLGAGVHQSAWGLHWGDGERPANTTVGLQNGDDGERRSTTSRGGGGAPAKSSRRHGARGRKQMTSPSPLPRGEVKGELDGDETAAGGRRARGSGDGGARVRKRWVGNAG
jgi:hypothetical protein